MGKRIIVALAALFALAVIALPAGATYTPPTGTGVRFGNVFRDDSRAIQANTAFYITQAFIVDDPNGGYCGGAGQPTCATATDVKQSSISLDVNGKNQSGNNVYTYTDTTPKVLISKANLFDFPKGLPVGHYVLTITFAIQGKNVGTFTHNVDAVQSCQYGTTNGLLCAPAP